MDLSIRPMMLGSVKLPETHPRAADGNCVIHGFVVTHPDGAIVVDTGVAGDHDVLNEISARHFDPANPPPRTLVGVTELAHPKMLVEIEGMVAIPLGT